MARRTGYEGLASTRCRSTTPTCPDQRLVAHARAAWDQALELGEKHGYRNAQATVIAPDRHDRPRDGLRHHRHRARLRAGEVQEARRRRLLQDHQPAPCRRRCARSATARAEIAEIEAYAVGHGTLDQAPGINHATLRAKGFTDEQDRRRREAASRPPSTSSSSSTSGRSARTSDATRSASRPRSSTTRPSSSCRCLGFSKARDRGRQHPCLRRDDAGRRAAPQGRASTRCSTAPIPAARSASATSRSRATSA